MPAVKADTPPAGCRASRARTPGPVLRAGLAVVAGGLALAGCGGGGTDLGGATYASTESRGHDLVPASRVTLTFTDGRISANAGCNTLNGAASWEGDTLEVRGSLASTMMACEDALMAQDTWLSEFLSSSPELAVEGDELVLGDATTGLTLTRTT